MKIALIVITIFLFIYLFISYIAFILICRKFNNYPIKTISKNITEALAPYQKLIEKGQKWVSNKNKEDIYIKSFDNLKLHGILIEKNNPKGIFIEVHGYRSEPTRDIYPSCYHYYNMGYNLLLVDQRTAGQSAGKYLTFGINESKDLYNWVKYINKKYPDLPIVLAGVSMGASTAMMSASLFNKSNNIKAILADSGFVSPIEEISYCIKHYFHVPPISLINMINIWCLLLGKFNLKSKNTIDCLNNNDIPLLLVHGEDDDFIPILNSKNNYEQYNGSKKEFVTFPKAYHGMGYLVDPKRYVDVIKSFIKE